MANNKIAEVGILKTLWTKSQDGSWSMHGLKWLMLKPRAGYEPDFFQFESKMEMLTDRPLISDRYGWLTSFGHTDFLLKQSIVPVVAWVEGAPFIKCIGTAFLISCTGYLITACHVLLDPYEQKQAKLVRADNSIKFPDGMRFGVLIPVSPATGNTGSLFYPFHDCRYWGQWKDSPLLHEAPTFEMLTDIAICKIGLLPDGSAHQPLTLSPNSFTKGERAFALGYAEMDNITVENRNGTLAVPDFSQDLYVSVGPVKDLFPDNHQQKVVPTPGPCFDFLAKVPGKMSGGPILGADGAVVRGVVSRSFTVAKQAYGAMVGPAMNLPLAGNVTLLTMREAGKEGIGKAIGAGL
jgi:Trypsin-like peptidase domain